MIQIKEIAALGTHWWFDLFDTPASKEQEVTDRIIERLRAFERRYSRFLNTSLIGILNRTGTLENPTDELISLLKFGQKLYTDTNGAFNFLSAHTQVTRGYGSPETVRRAAHNSAPADPTADLAIGERQITLSRGAVDLGGFGKGWIIDDIARILRTSLKTRHFLINGGGDIYATTLPDGSPIDILIEHPTEKNRFIAKVPLRNRGFAGSGTHKRRWQNSGAQHHHIIAQHTADTAAHIVAETAVTADVFATLACAVAPQDAPKMLKENNLEYLLMRKNNVACSEQFRRHLLAPA